MRYSFILIILIIQSSAASAQWRSNPFYFNFKGVKADSVLIVPRDTTYLNVGGEPDSARIAYKNKSLWVKTPTSWSRVGNKIYHLYDSITTFTAIGGETYYQYQNSLLVNKRIISIQIESNVLWPVSTVPEIYEGYYRGWANYVFDPALGKFVSFYLYDIPEYRPRMLILYEDL